MKTAFGVRMIRYNLSTPRSKSPDNNSERRETLKSLKDSENVGSDWVFSPANRTPLPSSMEASIGESIPFTGNGRTAPGQKKGLLRRFGPTGGILGLLFTVVVGGGMFLGPATQITHISETLKEKFSFGEYTSSRRLNKIYAQKLYNGKLVSTTPLFGSKLKFSKMSAKTVTKFEKYGFELYDDAGQRITGRVKKGGIAAIMDTENGGRLITADDIISELNNDSQLRGRFKKVFNSRLANWLDDKATAFKSKFSLLKNNSGVKRTNGDVDDAVSKQTSLDVDADVVVKEDGSAFDDDADGNKTTTLKPDAAESKSALSGVKEKLLGVKNSAGYKKVATSLSVLGYIQTACTVRQMMQTIAGGIKVIQTFQLMQNGQLFMAEADRIRAGNAEAETITGIGDKLTAQSSYDLDESGNKSPPKSGTQGQGYGWLAHNNQVNRLDGSASKYVAGGSWYSLFGFATAAQAFFKTILDVTGAIGGDGICAAVNHPVTMGVSILANVALTVVECLTEACTTAVARGLTQAAFTTTASFVLSTWVLPWLGKMLAGNLIGVDIAGQDYLNSVISGVGALQGKSAGAGGNLGLGKKQAIAMYSDYQNYIAQEAEDERNSRSPFDTGSKYTFLGSLASSIMPIVSSSSVTGIFTSIGSSAGSALSSLMPKADAFSLAKFKASLEVCKDDEYAAIGVATDPFCNPIYGVPAEYLDSIDPDSVVEELIASGDVEVVDPDEGTTKPKAGSDLEKYEQHCAGRGIDQPLGTVQDGSGITGKDWESGKKCVVSDSDSTSEIRQKSLYAMYFIDDRLENDLNGDGMAAAEGGFYGGVSNSAAPSANTPVEGGFSGENCTGVKDCSQKVLNNENITLLDNDTRTALQAIADTGQPQKTVCNNSVTGSMTVSPILLDSLLKLSDKYKIRINNFGFAGDRGPSYSCTKHVQGLAVDLNGISFADGTDNSAWSSIGNGTVFPKEQIPILTKYVSDFVTAVDGRARVRVGQTKNDSYGKMCNADFAKSMGNLGSKVLLHGDSCDHLHMALDLI
jgi:hypothetical protein